MGGSSPGDSPLKVLLGILFFVVAISAGYLGYLYYSGSVENYSPPAAPELGVGELV